MSLESLTTGDLTIHATEDEGVLRLIWTGKSNARAADRLIGPYLDHALERAAAIGSALELHFEQLVHFNSSTIASVIKLIEAARTKKTKLVLVSDPAREWQRLAFDALRVFILPDGMFDVRSP